MSDSEDEFDKHNAVPFDVEHLPYITDLPPSPVAPLSKHLQRETVSTAHVDIETDIDPILTADPQSSPKSDYSAYDLSEFTTDELQALEAEDPLPTVELKPSECVASTSEPHTPPMPSIFSIP